VLFKHRKKNEEGLKIKELAHQLQPPSLLITYGTGTYTQQFRDFFGGPVAAHTQLYYFPAFIR
jgi:hypothetical protein